LLLLSEGEDAYSGSWRMPPLAYLQIREALARKARLPNRLGSDVLTRLAPLRGDPMIERRDPARHLAD
jgi:hypothetical protein